MWKKTYKMNISIKHWFAKKTLFISLLLSSQQKKTLIFKIFDFNFR